VIYSSHRKNCLP